ncbi:MAG: acylphosphatase [Caldisericaceae bacterium]
MEKLRAEIYVYGIVQGVGFRYFTRTHARKIGLTGFVENLIDGSVHIVVDGTEASLKQFIEIVKRGPYGARVDKVDVKYSQVKNEFVDFEIY